MTGNTETFSDWVKFATESGMQCLDTVSAETLVFLRDKAGQPQMITVEHEADDPSETARLDAARDMIAGMDDFQYYALVWNGYLEGQEGESTEVIVIDAGSATGESAILAQPFEIDDDYDSQKAGPPMNLGTGENYWSAAAKAKDHPPANLPPNIQPAVAEEEEPITSLDGMAHHAVEMALEQMQGGDGRPFLYLMKDVEAQEDEVAGSDAEDVDFGQLHEALQQHVKTNTEAQMYAIAYTATAETEDGEEVDMIFVETGDRQGSALLFGLEFAIDESGEISTGEEVECLQEIANLWG